MVKMYNPYNWTIKHDKESELERKIRELALLRQRVFELECEIENLSEE